jgi:hypothetical protein
MVLLVAAAWSARLAEETRHIIRLVIGFNF